MRRLFCFAVSPAGCALRPLPGFAIDVRSPDKAIVGAGMGTEYGKHGGPYVADDSSLRLTFHHLKRLKRPNPAASRQTLGATGDLAR